MNPSMLPFALGVLFAVPVTLAVVALRSWRMRSAEAAGLADQVRGMALRIEAVETESSRSALRIDAAETVLLEKGVADEEDLLVGSRDLEADRWSLYRLDDDPAEVEDLAAEELAMHYVDEEAEVGLDNDDLPEDLRAALATE